MMNKNIINLVNFTGVKAVFIYNNTGENLFEYSTVTENPLISRSIVNLSRSVANSKKDGHQVKDVHLKLGKNEVLARGINNGYLILVVDKNITHDLFEDAYQQAIQEINPVIQAGRKITLETPAEIESVVPPKKSDLSSAIDDKVSSLQENIIWADFTIGLDNIFTAEEGKIGISKSVVSEWSQKHSIRKLHEVKLQLSNGEHIQMEISPRDHLEDYHARLAPNDAKEYGLKSGDTIQIHPLLI